MNDFSKAFQFMIDDEGGFDLHKVLDDFGGLTYAGITKKYYPNWEGWKYIESEKNLHKLIGAVYEFYEKEFWDKIKANSYSTFEIKNTVFNFAVNVGKRKAIKIMQKVLNTIEDGIIGPFTLMKLNNINPEIFCLKYTIEKISYYATICNKNPSQKKFLLGWINRTIKCHKIKEHN